MMPVFVGQVLRGRTASYLITKILKVGTVFQAKIVPRSQFTQNDSTDLPPMAFVIKHEPVEKLKVPYNRERACYEVESIAQSPYIRAMRDLVGHKQSHDIEDPAPQPQCMVFEWMDTDLWQLPSGPFRSGSKLPKIVAKSVLGALAVFHDLNGVHTDVNPNNVFVSGIHDHCPIVKLGDLGNLIVAGDMKYRYQGLHIRAPEVWRGIGIFHKADVWSVGVTLAHWLASKVIFGPSDKIIQDMTEAWCLAKMIRLIGPFDGPVNPEYGEEFAIAEFLEKETFVNPTTGAEERFVKLGTIRQELEAVSGQNIEKGCIDFIESLLVMDHTKRPTAREALNHPWLRDINGDDVD